ncbi:4-hydroxy-tetrahydrodipicolinate reductase [Lentibacillus amyloliquefaciens]|uniref:4-hydroxy-tetrahydrodipicolinate reductase n=1 Tax=Lentibacillus amyloliquefaciens TaxID=1472767 RepID=A0A0U4DRH8_9BACI|nr:4-hydroxy-tetrahydrodipicolinate reductase [Lentibacillus amyloliquefaciens]ALX47944.1 4-hydroxy-tetrahydrodipicolinate reductase [Lentibacillus amyloliquefaciens]
MQTGIIIAGPRGKMGSEAVRMVNNEETFKLIACIDRKNGGKTLNDIESLPNLDVPIFEDPEKCFQETEADVLIDLTVAEAGYEHTKLALLYSVRPVVGTSGFSRDQIAALEDLSETHGIGCIIAPNFAVGAVLMMQFAKTAAKYLPDVEIIEKHHDQKLDAPSGTAVKTANLMEETRQSKQQGHPDEEEKLEGARGAESDGIHIHSVRLPGLVAHQEVLFGGPGQTLTIKHDSYNRASFMEGVKLSVNKVMGLNKLIYGLENLLE